MSIQLPGDYFVLSTSLGSTAKQRQGPAPSFVPSRSDPEEREAAHWLFHAFGAQRLPRSLVPARGSFLLSFIVHASAAFPAAHA